MGEIYFCSCFEYDKIQDEDTTTGDQQAGIAGEVDPNKKAALRGISLY
jgi:hypothetical protein